jgi:hypothetical protein
VRFRAVGPVDAEVGAPTQMGIFTRQDIRNDVQRMDAHE